VTYEIKMTFLVKTFTEKKYAEMLEIIKKSLWENEELRDIQLIDFVCNEEKSDMTTIMYNLADERLLRQIKAEVMNHLKKIEFLLKCNEKEKPKDAALNQKR